MKIIKLSFVSLLLVLLFSCGNRKQNNVITDNPNLSESPPPPDLEITYVGVIALDENCGYVIKIQLDNKNISVAPKDLAAMYHKPGMRVRFTTEDVLDEKLKCEEHYIIGLKYITPLRG